MVCKTVNMKSTVIVLILKMVALYSSETLPIYQAACHVSKLNLIQRRLRSHKYLFLFEVLGTVSIKYLAAGWTFTDVSEKRTSLLISSLFGFFF
jgi:Flp pilus assembly protein protease CpaA